MAASVDVARLGRRPKTDESGVATRERLLAAAAAACAESGFDGATVADIAARADVSAPAIYNHFGGRVELMVAAGQAALDRLRPPGSRTSLTAMQVVRAYLADDFATTRRLLVELHLAAQRHPEVAALLASWHAEHAAGWGTRASGPDRAAVVKTFFALLLGLCQIESLSSIDGTNARVAAQAEALIAVLFPEEDLA